MAIVSKLSKSPSTTLDNRQRRMQVGTTALRGGLYKCTGESARGVVQGPSRLDYTLGFWRQSWLCCVHVSGRWIDFIVSSSQDCLACILH